MYPVAFIYISVSVSVPYCLDYCSFVVYSEVRETDSSSSVFLSQDCFGYSGSFVFPYKDPNVRPDTIKLLEENIGRILYDINHSKILFGPPPRGMEIKNKN